MKEAAEGRTVFLDYQTYREHIKLRHPEVADIEEVVRTVEKPEVVTFDMQEDTNEHYYRTIPSESDPKFRYSEVVVSYRTMAGRVVTAYRSPKIEPGEAPKWTA